MRKEIKRAAVLLPASFAANTGIGILNFSLVFYMRDQFSSSAAEIGWFSSVWAFSYFIGCIVLHRFSRRIGPRWSMTLAASGMVIFVLVMLNSGSSVLMFILYGLFGFITALFWPPLMGWLSEGFEGKDLNRIIGYFNLSWSMGLVVSPYLGGILLELRIGLPLVLAAVLYGVLSVALFMIPLFFPSILIHNRSKEKNLTVADKSTPLRFTAWLGNFTAYVVFGVLLFVFPLYARELLGFSESSIGLLLLFRALFSTLVFIFAGKMSWWHFNKIFMVITQLMIILFSMFFTFSQSWIFFAVSLSLFGILFAVQYSSSIFHGVSGSVHREKRMAVHEAVLTVGVITGSIGGGEIYQRWGMAAVFNTTAAVSFLILILQVAILGYQHRNK